MATIIQIKRSTGTTAPNTLSDGELAYTHGTGGQADNGDRLFIGDGSSVNVIGGEYFVNLMDHVHGTLTASSALLVDSNKAIDDFFVGNNSTTGGSLKLNEGTTNGTNYVALKSPNSLSANVTYTLPAAASAGDFLTTNSSGDLSWASVSSSFTLAADSGSNDTFNTSETLTFTGGEGIDTTVSNNTITFAAEDATSSNKGIATFNTADFDVTSGDVTIKALGVSNAQLAGSIANGKLVNDGITIGSDDTSLGDTITDLNGLTSVDVDNITLDANTISTTNSNGNLVLSPNGTGTVTVPSGYTSRAGFGNDSLVNKSYVDGVANGLDVKASVKVATTADLSATYNNGSGTLTAGSNGAISIDGVSLSASDRVLVKDQSTGAENGFYTVTTVGDGSTPFVLTRATDADDNTELTAGAFTFVEEGTANADNGYVLTTNGAITFGTTAITFDQFSGAGQIAAGNGLTKTGNTIDAVGTADKITVSANAITIASTYVGQTSITTLGTIATGTWNGDTIAYNYGGTGQTSYARGDIVYASAANTLAKLTLGSNGKILQSDGTDIVYGDIDGGTF
tara:strand:- start:179 stop:1885 length:1707 start_codon:yes stop_codon:yes gene_type:complete